ncbi:hypothetical protein [Flagellimonas crocea]|uniref:hypothetical protein n=1 Tax=Flagellimonas crocea TaxID=3067311 RepID=UPI0029700108|nr:hypothetical protein [Muricauda sp. DH64]
MFNYVTLCLYSKKKLHQNKSTNVLLKTIDYFSFEKISIKNNPKIEELVRQTFPNVQFDENSLDLLFVDEIDVPTFQKICSKGKLHNDSIVLVDSIHENKQHWEQWARLITLPEITVSIDMYHCGLISIRREQVKEHFTIRI